MTPDDETPPPLEPPEIESWNRLSRSAPFEEDEGGVAEDGVIARTEMSVHKETECSLPPSPL